MWVPQPRRRAFIKAISLLGKNWALDRVSGIFIGNPDRQLCGSGSGRFRIHLGPWIRIPNVDPDPEVYNEGKSRVLPRNFWGGGFLQEIIFF